MIKLLDTVAILKDLPKDKLLKGQVGTVVEQLDENVFEVEFTNAKGEAIAIMPIHSDELFLLHFELESV